MNPCVPCKPPSGNDSSLHAWLLAIVVVAFVLVITLVVALYDYEKDKTPRDLLPTRVVDVIANLQPSAPDNPKIFTNTEVSVLRDTYTITPKVQSVPTSVRLVTSTTSTTNGIYRARIGVYEAVVSLFFSTLKNVKTIRVSLVPFVWKGLQESIPLYSQTVNNVTLFPVSQVDAAGNASNQRFNAKLSLTLTQDVEASGGIMILVDQPDSVSRTGPTYYVLSGLDTTVKMRYFSPTSYQSYYGSNRLTEAPLSDNQVSTPIQQARAILSKKFDTDFV